MSFIRLNTWLSSIEHSSMWSKSSGKISQRWKLKFPNTAVEIALSTPALRGKFPLVEAIILRKHFSVSSQLAITLFEGLNNPSLSLWAKNFVSGRAFCDPSDVQHVSHRVRFFAIIAAYPEMYEIATTPKVICQTPYHLPLERRGWVDELGVDAGVGLPQR